MLSVRLGWHVLLLHVCLLACMVLLLGGLCHHLLLVLVLHPLLSWHQDAMIGAGTHSIGRSCLLENDLCLLLLCCHVLLLLWREHLLLRLLLHFLLACTRGPPLLVFMASHLLGCVLSNFLRLSHRCPIHLHLAFTRHLLLLLLHLLLLMLLLTGMRLGLRRSESGVWCCVLLNLQL